MICQALNVSASFGNLISFIQLYHNLYVSHLYKLKPAHTRKVQELCRPRVATITLMQKQLQLPASLKQYLSSLDQSLC